MNKVLMRITEVNRVYAYSVFRSLILAPIVCLTVFSNIAWCEESSADQTSSRIDFGNTYIQGQSIKSGAVYLTNRRKSALKSLLKTRESYRQEIVNDFYGRDMELEDTSLEPKAVPELNPSK